MSRKVLGIMLAIIGAITIMINISFFKESEWYDIVRWISYALFLIGIFLIPEYSKKKSGNKE
ncbi:hypothetical protein [Bacillus sp. 1P06AnD]|uniref:hypothetical protein n=1 Tax=Bacillus sp. 1P06AnD TaxID=3132208 RepID=UPI0039A3F2DC